MKITIQKHSLRLDTQNYKELDILAEVEECVQLLKAVGVDLTSNVYNVRISNRMTRTCGRCKRTSPNRYLITISANYIRNASPKGLHNTIMHEVCHSALNCYNHGSVWKKVVEKVNMAYGYSIERFNKDKLYMSFRESNAKYGIFCEECHKIITPYQRKTKTWNNIKHAQDNGYRCPYYCNHCKSHNLKAIEL